jgi:hypothetical protein
MLHSEAASFNIREFQRSERMQLCPRLGELYLPFGPSVTFRSNADLVWRRSKVKDRELNLIRGFLLCLRDSEAVRLQTSRWKRSLLVFSSGVCLEIALLPFLIGYETSWHVWLLAALFVPLGMIGLYASKFGNDRLVERLLVIPKLDLRI